MFGGRRQPSCGGTSRMTRECQVRICERLGVRFPGPTRQKRHVLVDTQGLMLHAIVTAADIQDRDGGAWLLGTLFGLYPFLLKLYADGGYQGQRSDRAKGFVVLPKRWVVERTLAWLNRCRRLSKDWENLNHKARAFLMMASIRFMVRRLCRA